VALQLWGARVHTARGGVAVPAVRGGVPHHVGGGVTLVSRAHAEDRGREGVHVALGVVCRPGICLHRTRPREGERVRGCREIKGHLRPQAKAYDVMYVLGEMLNQL
jgi:hypothetical protein